MVHKNIYKMNENGLTFLINVSRIRKIKLGYLLKTTRIFLFLHRHTEFNGEYIIIKKKKSSFNK